MSNTAASFAFLAELAEFNLPTTDRQKYLEVFRREFEDYGEYEIAAQHVIDILMSKFKVRRKSAKFKEVWKDIQKTEVRKLFGFGSSPFAALEEKARELLLDGHSELETIKILSEEAKRQLDRSQMTSELLDKIRYFTLTAKIKISENK